MNMMEKIFSVIAVALVLVSCAADLGNYEYHELAEPEIGGIKDEISVMTLERLKIVPSINGGLGEDAYDYEWKVIDRNNDQRLTVIGGEKNLDYEVTLVPGAYALYFTLTEKDTGVYWQKECLLTVNTSMSEGWMVLCSDGGRPRLDFISAVNPTVYKDVLKNNGMPQMQGPRRIHWQREMSYTDSPYYLFTDEGATRLGRDAFEWKEEYMMTYEMADMPDPAPYSMVSSGFGKMFVSGDRAYYCEVMGIVGLYGSPVNKNFRCSPYIGVNLMTNQIYVAVYLLYDIDNKRFMGYSPLIAAEDFGSQEPLADLETLGQIGDAFASSGEESIVGSAFQDFPEGYDMVYMENTKYDPGSSVMGICYSVLADGDRRYIYGIQLGDMIRYSPEIKNVFGKAYYGDASSCTDIVEAEFFAFSSLKNCMYYSVGDTVYAVDLSQDVLNSEVQFKLTGEKISVMKFNLYKTASKTNDSYDLIVGTEEGKLRIYEGYDSDGDFSDVEPLVYEGFMNIVDVAYKEKVY